VKPLPWIAMGLVVVAFAAEAGSYDLLANPVGWGLVLHGLTALPPTFALRSTLRHLAFLALVVAAATYPPVVLDPLNGAAESLRWAVSLPPIAFAAVLTHALAAAARARGDRRAATWWSGLRTATVVVGVLPVLVFGGGMASLSAVSGLLTVLTPVVTIVLLFSHGSRPWAVDPEQVGADAAG
jgi:hypothetical protein